MRPPCALGLPRLQAMAADLAAPNYLLRVMTRRCTVLGVDKADNLDSAAAPRNKIPRAAIPTLSPPFNRSTHSRIDTILRTAER
jgi:hypothetical protein